MRQATMSSPHVATLRDYLAVMQRRKWVIITAVVVVPLAGLAFSLTQSAQYEGSAEVLLSQQDLGSVLTGTQVNSGSADPADRQTQTQANLARVPDVAQRALSKLRLSMTPGAFLAASSVSPGTNADTLTFHVTNRDPDLASRMAAAYANAYVAYRLSVETAPIDAAKRGLDARLKQVPKGGALYNGLVEKEQTLAELEALKTSDASVIRSGGQAVQTTPRTKRNVALGIFLGLFLGIGLAFLYEALDTRVRSAEAIEERIGIPLLARLPEPSKKLRTDDELVMIAEPTSVPAEAFRMLRTNLEFAALGRDVKTIMVTSALEKEGKSTTIANLAVALARSGKRVALVDLDLRRPYLGRFFGLGARPGITQVAIGTAKLGEAMASIPIASEVSALAASHQNGSGNGNGASNGRLSGWLQVLGTGPTPPNPGEFIGTERMTEILKHLREHSDIVLIDAPPLFHVGDGLVLSSKVDGVIVVTRMDVMKRPMLSELHRLLETMPAAKLGFVVTGAEAEEGYGYGYGYYQQSYKRASEEKARA